VEGVGYGVGWIQAECSVEGVADVTDPSWMPTSSCNLHRTLPSSVVFAYWLGSYLERFGYVGAE
jgi:hypothetical protein